MSRSSQVFNLISGLSRGEKRQFKLQAYKYEKEGKHISEQLFDIFDSMKTWDEELFKHKLQNSGIGKSVAVHVNSLLSQLLDVLRTKESKTNIIFEINKLVEESIILTIRDEFTLALKRIRRAKSMAIDAELNEKLPEVLMHERSILQGMLGKKEYNEYRLQYYNTISETIKKLENEVEYFNLVEDLFFTFYNLGYPESDYKKSKYAEIMNNPLLQDLSLALSSSSKSSFYFVHTLYHQSHNNLKEARTVVQKQAAVYEQNKNFAKTHITTYISTLNNLALFQAQVDGFDEFSKTLKKLRAIPEEYSITDKFMEQRIFELSYGRELDFCITRDKIDEIDEAIPIIEEKVLHYSNNGSSFKRFLNLAFHIAIYHYRTGNLERSHLWVKKVLDHEGTLTSIYNILFAMILDLVIHFKLGDFKYLQYRIPTIEKYFRKHKQLIPVNESFFKMFKQLIRAKNPEHQNRSIANFKEKFDSLPNSMTKMFYTKYLAIEDLLESRIGLE